MQNLGGVKGAASKASFPVRKRDAEQKDKAKDPTPEVKPVPKKRPNFDAYRPPTATVAMPRLSNLKEGDGSRGDRRKIVHLNVFDGIGTFAYAWKIVGGPQPHVDIRWEIEEASVAVSTKHWPRAVHRGDAKELGTQEGQRYLLSVIPVDALIYVTGGFPCENTSSLGDGTGLEGPESSKFWFIVQLLRFLREHEERCRWVVHALVENVFPGMTAEEVQKVSGLLKLKPFLTDAADVSWVRRRRWFWTDIPHDLPEVPLRPDRSTPKDACKLDLTRKGQSGPGTTEDPPEIILSRGWTLRKTEWPGDVNELRRSTTRFFTISTMALADHGRPAPRDTVCPEELMHRWEDDERQFPPTQYHAGNLAWRRYEPAAHPHRGTLWEWRPLNAAERERLMGFDGTYTLVMNPKSGTNFPERERCRMIGRAWHVGVLRRLLSGHVHFVYDRIDRGYGRVPAPLCTVPCDRNWRLNKMRKDAGTGPFCHPERECRRSSDSAEQAQNGPREPREEDYH